MSKLEASSPLLDRAKGESELPITRTSAGDSREQTSIPAGGREEKSGRLKDCGEESQDSPLNDGAEVDKTESDQEDGGEVADSSQNGDGEGDGDQVSVLPPTPAAVVDVEDHQNLRRRSQSMAEVKAQAIDKLQEELKKAQEALQLKDEEVVKLSNVRGEMDKELEELTASLFEEAHAMVREANVRRAAADKKLAEAVSKIDVLQAEVVALKTLVITSTPSMPNSQPGGPQQGGGGGGGSGSKSKKKLSLGLNRRKTQPSFPSAHSHHQKTSSLGSLSALKLTAGDQQPPADVKEFDTVFHEEFSRWKDSPSLDRQSPFLSRVLQEEILPCLSFSNQQLSSRLLHSVQNNALCIEPLTLNADSFPRNCDLSEATKTCKYRIRLSEHDGGGLWHNISQGCRNRIAAVCDFYTYIRYIHHGLVKNDVSEIYWEVVRLRQQMALAKYGLNSTPEGAAGS